MAELKQKRMAKAAKAAEFLLNVEAGLGEEESLMTAPIHAQRKAATLASATKTAPTAAAGPVAIVQVGRNLATVKPKEALSEEELKAQVASMVAGRRQAFERNRQAHTALSTPTSTSTAAAQSERAGAGKKVAESSSSSSELEQKEEALDLLLATMVDTSVLSEAQVDTLTDAIARGDISIAECLVGGQDGVLSALEAVRYG